MIEIIIDIFKPTLLLYAKILGIHNWEYWEVKVHYKTACGKHTRMNHWSVVPNRKCKWTGKKQHKVHSYNPRMMKNPWREGNREHNEVVKIYMSDSCERCFDLYHGYDKKVNNLNLLNKKI